MTQPPYPPQQPNYGQPPVVIYNTNQNTNTNVNTARGSGDSRTGLYLILFFLGFCTGGVTWLILLIVVIVDACSSPSVPVVPMPVTPPNPAQLAGQNDRAYATRAINLAWSGGFIDTVEHSRRAVIINEGKTIGDIDRAIYDIPPNLRQQAWHVPAPKKSLKEIFWDGKAKFLTIGLGALIFLIVLANIAAA